MTEEQKQNNITEEQKQNSSGEEMSELRKCEKERDEYLAGWQRAKADLINYKREEAERFQEFAKYHNAEFILELVSILDNFDLALLAMEKSKEVSASGGDGVGVPTPKAGGVEKGIYMIRAQMEDILRKRGLARIEVKKGDDFNPQVMEAIAEVGSDLPEGKVVEEIEAGYRLYDRILRPARVKVSKGQKQD
jgi:molecular chaperone GrpE